MKRSLQSRLTLTYLAVALLTVLVVVVLLWMTSGQTLMNLVVEQETANLTAAAQSYYITNGSLDGFFIAYIQALRPNPGVTKPGEPDMFPERRVVRGLNGLVDTEYRAVMPTLGYDIGQTIPKELISKAIPVEVDGKTVAWIIQDNKFQFKLSPEEELFLRRSMVASSLAALVGVLAAVLMGFMLARILLKPIRRLTQASQALARGNLEQQVPVTSQDELGQLTITFNQMSADLLRADQQRKRMTADVTHDLSTPLQIISGYIEMLEDGEVVLTPQRLGIIKTEVEHLRRLVGDLTTLSQVESGGLEMHLEPVRPTDLLEKVYTAYCLIAEKQGVELAVDVPESPGTIMVDEGRMIQVLKNLVENALRYTPKGGKITLGAFFGKTVQLKVSDTGSGIDPEDLPYVFDRFYRADKVRGANSGKMGLGLAICKALVNAQNGVITAESAGVNRGTSIMIDIQSYS